MKKIEEISTAVNNEIERLAQDLDLELDAVIAPAMRKTVYTDGGYSRRRGIGACAFVILDNDGKMVKEGSKAFKGGTNQTAELRACLNAAYNLPDGSHAVFMTDSRYAIGVLSGGMRAKANLDLIAQWNNLVASKHLTVRWEWVRGHSGETWNDYCDSLCNKAAGFNLNAEIERYRS